MKKLVSLLLVFVMVLSVFTIVPFTASAADTKTVYFQNNWMWTDVKVYYWGSSSTNSAGWPGDTPQLVGNDGTYDIYAATVPTDITGIIFNGFDGGINANNQTPDILDSADGDCYYMVWNNQNEVGKAPISDILPDIVTPTSDPNPNPNPSGSKTVYFQNNWMWTDVKVYAWSAAGDYTAAWPGDTPQLAGNDGTYDIYSVTVPNDITGVIFNGFDSGMGGNNQTPDILDSADGDMYYMVWNEAEAKNDLGKTVYNPVDPTEEPQPTQPTPTQPTPTQPTPTQAEVEGLFVKVGGELYEVNKGDTFTYNYYLSVDTALKVSSLDINMFYDTEGLDLVPFTDDYGDVDMAKHFPIISGGTVQNFAIDGEIYYNYSSVAGIRLPENSMIFTAQFKVTADKGIYEITEKVVTMADSDMNKIVYDAVVLQDVFTQKVEVADASPVDPTFPTEEKTEAPTQPIVDDGLYVVADGVKFAVNKGDVVTYNYYLTVDTALKISSLDINTFYDTEGLDFVPFTDDYGDADLLKHFPLINGGVVNNFGIDGELYYNYSSVAGIRLPEGSVIFTGQFKVTADKGTYNIDSFLVTLADSDMNKIVYDKEVIQPSVYTVKTDLLGGEIPTEATKPTEGTKPTEEVKPTQPIVDDGLYVVADGVKFAVNKGDVVTYNYYLTVDTALKISSLDINTFYDTEGLDFVPFTDDYGDADLLKHFPLINGGVVNNFGIDGELYYNYSSVAGIRLPEGSVIFTGQFKVTADKGTYNIDSFLVTLADSDMNKIVYDKEVIQPSVYTVKTELLGGEIPTESTESTEPTKPVTKGVFVEMDGELYKVEKDQVITYQYILNVPNGTKISSIDMNTFYDTKGLDFMPYTDDYGDVNAVKHFPRISGGCVYNFGIDGEIYYNFSNVAGIRLTDDAIMFEGQFKVTADEGTYKIYTNLVTLADSDMNKIVYDHEVIQNIYEEKEVLVDLKPYDPNDDPDYLIGDVNRDGKVNVFDVSEIQRYAAAYIELDDEQMIIGDTNFDGKVNIFDASEIQRFLAGDITEFTKK